jgi:hypothetical protein
VVAYYVQRVSDPAQNKQRLATNTQLEHWNHYCSNCLVASTTYLRSTSSFTSRHSLSSDQEVNRIVDVPFTATLNRPQKIQAKTQDQSHGALKTVYSLCQDDVALEELGHQINTSGPVSTSQRSSAQRGAIFRTAVHAMLEAWVEEVHGLLLEAVRHRLDDFDDLEAEVAVEDNKSGGILIAACEGKYVQSLATAAPPSHVLQHRFARELRYSLRHVISRLY